MKNAMSVHGLAVFAGCALALSALDSAAQQAPIPIKAYGYATHIVDLRTGADRSGGAEAPNGGVATITGRFTNEASGNFFTGQLTGTVTAANGDQFSWKMPGSTWQVELTPGTGTGRFANLSGGFNIVSQSEPVITYPDANTMVVSYTYVGIGQCTLGVGAHSK